MRTKRERSQNWPGITHLVFRLFWNALRLYGARVSLYIVFHIAGIRGYIDAKLKSQTVPKVGVPSKLLSLSLVHVNDFHLCFGSVLFSSKRKRVSKV